MAAEKIVKMLSAVNVYPEGVYLISVNIGQVISLPDILADGLVRDKLAEYVDSSSPVYTQEQLDELETLRLEEEALQKAGNPDAGAAAISTAKVEAEVASALAAENPKSKKK